MKSPLPHSVAHPVLKQRVYGFTLAELLISLAILGVIATFTIPKVLQAQQDASNNAKAMEFAATISAAYQQLLQSGGVDNNTGPYSLIPYMNYVSYDVGAPVIDLEQGNATISQACNPCISMHNGGRAGFGNSFAFSFGGNGPTNAMFFMYDPDGKVTDGTASGAGKSVIFLLFRNGRVTSAGKYAASYCMQSGCTVTTAGQDPPWLKW